LHCIKNKGGSTNPLHTFDLALFTHAGTSSVVEFCIGDFVTRFSYEKLLFMHSKITVKSLTP